MTGDNELYVRTYLHVYACTTGQLALFLRKLQLHAICIVSMAIYDLAKNAIIKLQMHVFIATIEWFQYPYKFTLIQL